MKVRVRDGAPCTLNLPVFDYGLFQVGTFNVVPSSYMFILFEVLVLFPAMYVSVFSYIYIPESTPIWERADD